MVALRNEGATWVSLPSITPGERHSGFGEKYSSVKAKNDYRTVV